MASIKCDDEVGAGFRNHGDAFAALKNIGQLVGERDGARTGLAIGKRLGDFAAQIEECVAGLALRRIIERVAKGRETADLVRQGFVGARERLFRRS